MNIPESNFDNPMLPENHSQADAEWIKQQLLRLPPSLRRKVLLKYADVYEVTFDVEPVSYRKENRARHEANVRLRKFVETHGRAIQGYTALPPLVGTQQRS